MKTAVMAVLALTMVLAFAATPLLAAHAAPLPSVSDASCVGANHGAFANTNGNFGWLGDLGGTPGYHDAVGQQTGATGYNNSTDASSCLSN